MLSYHGSRERPAKVLVEPLRHGGDVLVPLTTEQELVLLVEGVEVLLHLVRNAKNYVCPALQEVRGLLWVTLLHEGLRHRRGHVVGLVHQVTLEEEDQLHILPKGELAHVIGELIPAHSGGSPQVNVSGKGLGHGLCHVQYLVGLHGV